MPIAVCRSEILFALAATLWSGFAAADPAAAPDKSGYSLFDPTPDDALRAFAPDRPTKITGPTTVDAGHFQIETDIFNQTYDRRNEQGVTTRQILWFDPTLKLGITNDVDAEISFVPYAKLHATDKVSGAVLSAESQGDVSLRAKINLIGNEGGAFAAAIIPWVKIPTAGANLGNGQLEGGFLVPTTFDLGSDFTLAYQPALSLLANNFDNGRHADFQNTLTLGHPFLTKGTAFVEIFHEIGADRGARSIMTVDFALAWLLTDSLQIDAGVNLGVTRAAPDVNSYTGIAVRF